MASDSSPNGTPWKLRGFQPDQYRWFSGARLWNFQDLQVSTFDFSEFILFLIKFWEDPGAPREHPGTTEDPFGGSWVLQGPFCVEVTFQKYKNHGKSTVECFPWQCSTKIGGIDAESMPGHFPTIHLYQKLQIYRPNGRYVNNNIKLLSMCPRIGTNLAWCFCRCVFCTTCCQCCFTLIHLVWI